MLIRISVRTLAEFIHRQGDLYPSLGGRVSGEEGIRMQRVAQQNRPSDYQREVAVQQTIPHQGLEIRVAGRVDGCDLSTRPALVEEIKTTRAEADIAERLLGSAHWAQATLYAAILAREHPEIEQWTLRLLYCHPDTQSCVAFDRLASTSDLEHFLMQTIERYGGWMSDQQAYQTSRNDWLQQRAFPYGEFRPHQRAMASRLFNAFKNGEHLLLEAPTGSGKTMGLLYPALKALAAGSVDRLFYLTSRRTGAIAVIKACEDLTDQSGAPRVVELIAKEKACPVAGMPCDDSCEYAVGYYDRIKGAVTDLLEVRHMSADAVQRVAEQHKTCPFELSLDAALWADLIIGDYNYLLDPVVRLQRFLDDNRLGVLIDESHQLADRTRDMLSLTLERTEVRLALKESPPGALSARLKSVDRALMALRRELPGGDDQPIDAPASLLRSVQRAMDALADDVLDLNAYPATRLLMFNLSRWVRADAWYHPDDFRYFAESIEPERRGRNIRVQLSCLDPARYLEEVLGGYGPHVRFSGTLSPLSLYQSLHGQPQAASERVESSFRPEQLATLIVHDLPVYYRQRQRTLPRLAQLIVEIVAKRTGNYLVALPSFDYLEQLVDRLTEHHPDLATVVQTPSMSEQARTGFLQQFQNDGQTRLGIIVLGGVFSESVDFSHAPLAGVISVGVGLPPNNAYRKALVGRFDEALGPGGGDAVTFQQPAMTKVLQMAGRLLRGPDDRGILCLIDDRFLKPEFQRFFPLHWQPEPIRANQVARRLENFWQQTSHQPRLPATVQPIHP